MKATLVCRADLDDDTAYAIVKTIFENTDAIIAGHAKGAELSLEFATDGIAVSVDTYANLRYTLQRATDLLADEPFAPVDGPSDAAVGTGAPLDLIDPAPDDAAPALFYRVRVTTP